jgi:membrane protease YdiL (CAAX protease family)
MSSINTSTDALSVDPFRSRRIVGLIFAYLFPTIITWCYFVLAGRYPMGTQQTVFLVVKIVQFALPAAWTFFALREPLRTSKPTVSGVMIGAAFAASVVGAGLVVFKTALQHLPVFTTAAELIQHKIAAFGIASTASYFVLAAFYSLVHSLLEEYYWRWFVFQQTRRVIAFWPAAVLSSVGFTLHHIVVLSVFFRGVPWLVALLSAAIAIGGIFWAWLFNRRASVFDTWVSHLLIDAGIFAIGYELVRQSFVSAS